MLDWKKNQHGTTALLIRGARRIGKSTIAEEFARNEYESYLVVDFAKARRKRPARRKIAGRLTFG